MPCMHDVLVIVCIISIISIHSRLNFFLALLKHESKRSQRTRERLTRIVQRPLSCMNNCAAVVAGVWLPTYSCCISRLFLFFTVYLVCPRLSPVSTCPKQQHPCNHHLCPPLTFIFTSSGTRGNQCVIYWYYLADDCNCATPGY